MANTLDTFNAITNLILGDLLHVKRGTGANSDVKITEADLRTAIVTAAAVQAATATMDGDTDLSSKSWFLDEDNMVSDDDTKVASQQSVKAYVDTATVGALKYQTTYDANTNTPDLTTSPNSIQKGQYWVVSVAGTFYTANVEIGDTLIAEQDDPSAEAHWGILQTNLDAATIKTLYESNADTNAFTDAEKTNLAAAILDGDFSAAEGFMRKTGAAAYEAIKSNLTAVDAPDANDDSGSGYAAGSIWLDTVAGIAYTCTDASVGAAVWSSGGGGGGGGMTVVHKSGNYTASAGEIVFCDTNVAAMTITLPATPSGDDRVIVVDAAGNGATNNITVGRNGETILGSATDFVIDQNYGQADFAYEGTDTDWLAALTGTADVVNVEAYVTGAETFLIRPGDMVAAVGSVAQVTAGVVGGNYKVHALSFSASVYESAAFPLIMPQRWDEGQFRFRLLWNPTSVNTGNVYWGMYGDSAISGATSVNDDSVGAGLSPLAANGTADSPHLTPWSTWFSWDDTPALDEILYLRVQRNGGDASDTYTGEAELQLVELQWVSNAATDD